MKPGSFGEAVIAIGLKGSPLAVVGVGLVYVGAQCIRGTVRDTLGNAIGAIVIGAISCTISVKMFTAGNTLLAGGSLLVAVGMMVAAVLALVGRSDSLAWRQT